ncbi:MAG: hypothetical protein HXS41_13645 [Theionarchaea archaeon]|nr:hypothetical protein [Theionarchaea archaeon]MBU7001224.1 hypothetical protein [Theionarchaea archaeon]MBU7022094.1 hypothetical protein [Theionarchaea archaeon]MBU7035657.1 hypothetical protein [Theionarchaea archaeon]MBU7040852.1 hypothetical protein [Theionarchaea archaeon]
MPSTEQSRPLKKKDYPRLKPLFKEMDDHIEFMKDLEVTCFPAGAVLSVVAWVLVFLLFHLGYLESESFPAAIFIFMAYCALLLFHYFLYQDLKRKPRRKTPIRVEKYEKQDPHDIMLESGLF